MTIATATIASRRLHCLLRVTWPVEIELALEQDVVPV
jgi:hypothetical protein